MVYTSLTQVSSPNLHHTSFTCQSGYTRSALGELCDDDIMAVAQRPLHDEITVEGASMKTGVAGKGADYRRYVESWPRQCAGLCRRRSAPVDLYEAEHGVAGRDRAPGNTIAVSVLQPLPWQRPARSQAFAPPLTRLPAATRPRCRCPTAYGRPIRRPSAEHWRVLGWYPVMQDE
jgi:hypothetical protein